MTEMEAPNFNLSPLVIDHIQRLFPEENQRVVKLRLHEECGGRLYRQMDWTTVTERVHCAIIKLSEGDMDGLDQAITLFQENWKKVLIEAGFGEDPNAHIKWSEE